MITPLSEYCLIPPQETYVEQEEGEEENEGEDIDYDEEDDIDNMSLFDKRTSVQN